MRIQAYCVKCNRNKEKGVWIPCTPDDVEVSKIDTKTGPKHFMKGVCPVCKSRLTKIISKRDYNKCL